MLERTNNDTVSLRKHANLLRKLIEAAANNKTDEVYAIAPTLCEFDGAGRSIISASPIMEDDGSISIGAFFRPMTDIERFPPPTQPRRFDVLFFAALRWMDAACAPNTGQGFFYQSLPRLVDGIQKYYLRFGDGTRKPGARVYVTRIVVDAGAGEAARFAEEHHSYRRSDLLAVAQRNPRLPKGELGRSQAIRLAVSMFCSQYSVAGSDGVTSFEYEALLLDLLEFGDKFHRGGETDR